MRATKSGLKNINLSVPPQAGMLWPHSCSDTHHRSDQKGCCLEWCQAWSRLFGRSRRFDRCVGSSLRREPAPRGWSLTMSSINTDIMSEQWQPYSFLLANVCFLLNSKLYSTFYILAYFQAYQRLHTVVYLAFHLFTIIVIIIVNYLL